MVILGVDPGVLHTGVCVVKNGKPAYRTTIVPARKKDPYYTFLPEILSSILAVVDTYGPDIAAVEQVSWYGKGRRIILPLSHIAGAITGALLSHGVPVYCLTPTMKKTVTLKGINSSWDEHQKDAAMLATVAASAESVSDAAKPSIQRQYSAAKARRIIILPSAPSQPSGKGKAGKT